MSVDAVLIAGPTGSGKSAIALELAKRLGGTIINADSMQVYAQLRILTARPSPSDEAMVPHRLYGHVSVSERYSAGRYQDEASRAFAEVRESNRIPIFVGGTGFYFSALTEGLSPIPAVPVEVRGAVRERFNEMGREGFFAALSARDPTVAGKLRISDTQRILRAADVLEATGIPLSEWQRVSGKPVLVGSGVRCYVIAPPRDVLHTWLERRFRAMVDAGALEEVRALVSLDQSLPAAKALGVPPLLRYLLGEHSLETAISEAQISTRQYAKRQVTWFRNRLLGWKWLRDAELSNLISMIASDIA
jgi:tRNA dimethylallyltransferase